MKNEPKMIFVTNMHFNKYGNGGQQRTYHLIKELSKKIELVVVSPYIGNENELSGIEANFLVNQGIATRKKSQQNLWAKVTFRMQNLWLSIFYSKYKETIHLQPFICFQLSNQLKNLSHQSKYKDFNTIIYDTLSTVVPLPIETYKYRILNAHNVDFELAETNLATKIKNQESQEVINASINHIRLLKKYECNVDNYFDEIWVCSKEDTVKFKKANLGTNVKFFNLPNGSDPEARPLQTFQNKYHKFLFVGSLNYKPNYSGLQWFVDVIFKHLEGQFQLDIVGRSPNPKHFKYAEEYTNINLIGEVDDLEDVYQRYDVMVVPLLEGSGTRLKILEAMSYGKLVLSTAKGIEGIEATQNQHYLEFYTLEDFESILNNLANHKTLTTIRANARQLIEQKYSWSVIVSNYLEKKYD